MNRNSFDDILQSDYVAITQGNGYKNSFDNCLAYGNTRFSSTTFAELEKELDNCENRIYGYLSYDLKNQLESLESKNSDKLNFSAQFFFQPDQQKEFNAATISPNPINTNVKFNCDWTKEEYIKTVKTFQKHILEGDIYEVNFCMEFHAEDIRLSPFDLYLKLNQLSPTPFSSFIKNKDQYIISASPERFLKRTGNKIISQPIKGTSRRHKDPIDDIKAREYLANSEKEQAENLMIVDLVRNDLSRTALPGTVKVDELFGIYAFPQVYQMISTVSSEVSQGTSSIEVIKKAYPMGSMTGAPKIMAMNLIEKYEKAKRGPFSGAVGYIDPNGDFDFNVVIRSIFYNESTQQLTFQVGSAITIDSKPESEYEECFLKAKAIFACFE